MKFALIDRIVSLEKGSKIVAIKNLTMAEEYLQDHFPTFPVMPGVLILETIVQAGGWLLRATSDFAHSTILLKEAKAVRYKSFVSPGDTLRVECELLSVENGICTIKGTGYVGELSVCNAKFYLEQKNLKDSSEDLADTDARMLNSAKQMFAQIWKG